MIEAVIVDPGGFMRLVHFGMMIVPLLFILMMAMVTYVSFARKSASTSLSAAVMKEMRQDRR